MQFRVPRKQMVHKNLYNELVIVFFITSKYSFLIEIYSDFILFLILNYSFLKNALSNVLSNFLKIQKL